MADLSAPHDRFFKALMEQPAAAGALLRERLPAAVAALLAEAAPEPVPGSFVNLSPLARPWPSTIPTACFAPG